jgi:hypothetical protein
MHEVMPTRQGEALCDGVEAHPWGAALTEEEKHAAVVDSNSSSTEEVCGYGRVSTAA